MKHRVGRYYAVINVMFAIELGVNVDAYVFERFYFFNFIAIQEYFTKFAVGEEFCFVYRKSTSIFVGPVFHLNGLREQNFP